MQKINVLDAVERLISTFNKVDSFDVAGIDLSDRVLDNRIITLEGYVRFLESEGIPKLETIRDSLVKKIDDEGIGATNDRSDLL